MVRGMLPHSDLSWKFCRESLRHAEDLHNRMGISKYKMKTPMWTMFETIPAIQN